MNAMQFGIFTVGDIAPDPATGQAPTEHERIRRMVETALKAEEVAVFAAPEDWGGAAAPDLLARRVDRAAAQLAVEIHRRDAPAVRDPFESVGGGYALRAADLDLTEFQRQLGVAREARRTGDAPATATALRTALDLWHGTPLAGVNGDYAEFERTRLGQLRLTAIEDLAAADIESGRPVEAAAQLAEVIAEQPLRERPRELLMLALYRSGPAGRLLELSGLDRYYYHEPLRMFARNRAFADDGPEASRAALTRLARFHRAEEGRLRAGV